MSKLNLNKRVYSKTQYEKVIDTKFSQTTTPPPVNSFEANVTNVFSNISIDQFFSYYNDLFTQIPKSGENSHSTLVAKSSEYIYGGNNEYILPEIQALIDEINLLQAQNLELNQQLIIIQTSGSQQI